jgi:hypothetical protein
LPTSFVGLYSYSIRFLSQFGFVPPPDYLYAPLSILPPSLRFVSNGDASLSGARDGSIVPQVQYGSDGVVGKSYQQK